MLVLSRKLNERIAIGENVTLTVLEIRGNQIRLGIEAPKEIAIRRTELAPRNDGAHPVTSIGRHRGDL